MAARLASGSGVRSWRAEEDPAAEGERRPGMARGPREERAGRLGPPAGRSGEEESPDGRDRLVRGTGEGSWGGVGPAAPGLAELGRRGTEGGWAGCWAVGPVAGLLFFFFLFSRFIF